MYKLTVNKLCITTQLVSPCLGMDVNAGCHNNLFNAFLPNFTSLQSQVQHQTGTYKAVAQRTPDLTSCDHYQPITREHPTNIIQLE